MRRERLGSETIPSASASGASIKVSRSKRGSKSGKVMVGTTEAIRPETARGLHSAWLATGLAVGGLTATALTVARWSTWQPYEPLLIPYDFSILVLGYGVFFWALGAWIEPRIGQALTNSSAWFLVTALLLWIWLEGFRGAGGGLGLKLASGAIIVLLGMCVLWNLWQRRTGGCSLLWISCLGVLCLGISLIAYSLWKPMALLYPLAATLPLLAGIPRLVVTKGVLSATAASVGISVIMCLLFVSPRSSQWIGTQITTKDIDGPSVILIVVDTLRQDHLSLYGYRRPTSPHIDAWAGDALVFTDATAASSWTLPTHASMFTGLFPVSHGAHAFRGTDPVRNVKPLIEQAPTLAQLVSEAGYLTAAVVANVNFLAPRFGLDRGFETYWVGIPRKGATFGPSDWLAREWSRWRYEEVDWPYYRAPLITDNAIRWLDAARPQPFFLFINYMDTHFPNGRPPTPTTASEPSMPQYEGRILTKADLDFVEPVLQGDPIDPRIQATLIGEYNRELTFLDLELNRLFEYLDSSGLADDTYVILTSDHGEYFGEHNLLFHSKHLHESVVKVPLVIKGPGVSPGRSSKPVHSVDIFSTVLEMLEVSFDGLAHGNSVFAMRDTAIVAELYAGLNPRMLDPSFHGRFDRDLKTIRWQHLKLFADDRGNVQLYDWVRDPRETDDLAASETHAVREMMERLRIWSEQHVPAPSPSRGAESKDQKPLSEEEIERLRALGYLE
jgi:arylsulfatase A-like enzyme